MRIADTILFIAGHIYFYEIHLRQGKLVFKPRAFSADSIGLPIISLRKYKGAWHCESGIETALGEQIMDDIEHLFVAL